MDSPVHAARQERGQTKALLSSAAPIQMGRLPQVKTPTTLKIIRLKTKTKLKLLRRMREQTGSPHRVKTVRDLRAAQLRRMDEAFPREKDRKTLAFSFTAGEETVTINSGEINAKAGDILKLVYDEKGKVSSVEVAKNVMDLSSMNRGGFGGFGEAPTGEGFKPGDKIGSGTTDGAIASKKS
jgi:hypothetical protein